MLEDLYENDADRETVIESLMVEIESYIYFRGSTLLDQEIGRMLGDLIHAFYLSSDRVVRRLCPSLENMDQIARMVTIVNSALIWAGRPNESVTENIFLNEL